MAQRKPISGGRTLEAKCDPVMFFNKVRIVLVEPQHPGNIGQAARAMKTMGLHRLYLVNPKRFPHPEALYLASRADDVVQNAVVTHHVLEAISDCSVVFTMSARERIVEQTLINHREAANKIDRKSVV